jgi:hypothetical protein
MPRSYNGHYAGLSNRSKEFDPPTGRQNINRDSND